METSSGLPLIPEGGCVEYISWNVFQQTESLEQSQGSQESNFHFLFHNN